MLWLIGDPFVESAYACASGEHGVPVAVEVQNVIVRFAPRRGPDRNTGGTGTRLFCAKAAGAHSKARIGSSRLNSIRVELLTGVHVIERLARVVRSLHPADFLMSQVVVSFVGHGF